jgi:hypothetical protein
VFAQVRVPKNLIINVKEEEKSIVLAVLLGARAVADNSYS